EVAQLEDHRLELGTKRRRAGVILEHSRAAEHREAPDVQAWRLSRLLARLGRRGWKALGEIGEIELAAPAHHGPHIGLLQQDVAEAWTEPPDRGELQRDAQMLE